MRNLDYFTSNLLSLLICCLIGSIFSVNAYTQSDTYKKVEITIENDTAFETLGKLGIDLVCGSHLEGGHDTHGTHNHDGHSHAAELLTLEVSSAEYQAIVDNNFKVEVLIDDLSTFYAKRNLKDLPKALAELKKAKQESVNKNVEVGQDLGCTENGLAVPQNFELGSMGGFITFQEMQDNLDQMRNLYPNLITAKASAHPTLTTDEGRALYYVKISDNPDVDENESEVLYTGVHHAREPLSMMNQIYYMWFLLENYATDPTIKNLVDNTEMYFIPIVNPDGYAYNESTNPNGGGMWRKNRRNNGNGTYGVDPNRNYGYNWGYNNTGSSGSSNSDTYRGPSPFSEPETQIVKAFAESHNFVNAFNNHSYSNLLLHAWGHITTPTPDEELYDEISEHMAWHNRYSYGNSYVTIDYPTNGDASDWFYGEQNTKNKTLGWIPEIGTSAEGGFWPSPIYIVDQCARHTRMSLIAAASASNYGLLNDLTPHSLDAQNPTLNFSVQHLSLTPGSFTVSVSSTNPYVQSIATPTMTTGNLTDANADLLSTTVTLDPNTPAGENIIFDIVLNNGTYDIHTTTITKRYNLPVEFSDACANMNNWSSSSWGVDNSIGFDANGSITDSPNGNSTGGTQYITLDTPLDFSNIQEPVLEYYTKWDITRIYDYVQLEGSPDGGSTWYQICANYTKPGSLTNTQPTAAPLYDGLQKTWVREHIDLSGYAGLSAVSLRFKIFTNSSADASDGFAFDDVKLYREPLGHCDDGVLSGDETGIDCGGVDCLPCPSCTDGVQNGNETGVDCGGPDCSVCPPEYCPTWNFDFAPVLSYDPGQDLGQFEVQENGATLFMENNAWKAIPINYTVTPNTVLEFDFKSTIEGEIHEVAFDNDLLLGGDHRIVIYGNQGYAGTFTNNPTYNGSGNYQHFSIPIGQTFTGFYEFLALTADHDAAPSNGNSYFRNIQMYEDVDGDGICDDVACMPGDACDDGDVCTTGETFDNNCNCTGGTLVDADNDGVCDANDQCAGTDDAIIGTSCDDGDACTTNDAFDNSCNCVGTFADADNDGVCDADDVCAGSDDTMDVDGDGTPDGCDTCDGNIAGTPCNDGDVCTTGETFDSNCDCVGGTLVDDDNDGVCNLNDICPGGNDNFDMDNDGIPNDCDECDNSLIGSGCNDNDACTVGDVFDANCNCIGTLADADNDGVCDMDDICPNGDDNADIDGDGTPNACDACNDNLVGMSCDDGDACTTGDVYDANCNCAGTIADADNDGVCDADDICANGDDALDSDSDGTPDACDNCDNNMIGTSCDDGDACTTGDAYDANCNCIGTLVDADNDGVCDADDICPNGDDTIDIDGDNIPDACDTCDGNLIGLSCDDGDACTTGDVYDANCNCAGTVADADNDGVCDADDICANGDDALDVDGDGTPDACDNCDDNLVGTSCDDGDACTTGDAYDANCNCVGTLADADNDGVCDADDMCPNFDDTLNGTSCDDGDACTTNDTYVACNCVGTFTDSDNDGVCDEDDICVGDDTVDADGNGIPDDCDAGNDPCPALDFNQETILSYDQGQDFGPHDILDSGATLFMDGNAWKAIDINYTVTPNTVIEFDFKSTVEGEIHEVAFDNDLVILPDHRIVVYGNQGYGGTIQNQGYIANGNYQHFTIPIGAAFTGFFQYLVLTADHDASPSNGNSFYRNVKIYEDMNGDLNCDYACTPGQACNDGDDCTVGETYDANCNCNGGTLLDDDNDGVCNLDDICPTMNDLLIGTPCDDGDACTSNDVYTTDCGCSGEFTDADGDGYCVGDDPDDNDGCNPDAGSMACSTCYTIIDEGFDSGWGIWNDGGSDSYRTSAIAFTGSHSIRLRDNSGSRSSMYTDPMDLSNFASLEMSFLFYSYSMENGEDFFVEVSTDGGFNFTTIMQLASGVDFQNNGWYETILSIPEMDLSENTVLRIRCDASGNGDQIYIDDVFVEGCGASAAPRITADDDNALRLDNESAAELMSINDLKLYPNPASDYLNINLASMLQNSTAASAQISIYSLDGRQVYTQEMPTTEIMQLNIQDIPANQSYVVRIVFSDAKVFTGKFLKF